MVAAYSLLDTADKGRRAYWRTHQARAEAAPSPAFATGGSLPARPRSLPDLPLASAAASATVASAAAFAHAAAGVAAACAACLPPPAAYGGAAASSIAEQHSTAVPVAAAVLDATLFHATASLAIPALAINRCGWEWVRGSKWGCAMLGTELRAACCRWMLRQAGPGWPPSLLAQRPANALSCILYFPTLLLDSACHHHRLYTHPRHRPHCFSPSPQDGVGHPPPAVAPRPGAPARQPTRRRPLGCRPSAHTAGGAAH